MCGGGDSIVIEYNHFFVGGSMNYVPLLVSFTFLCSAAVAGDASVKLPRTMEIRYYNTMHDVDEGYPDKPNGSIEVRITPTTKFRDIEQQLHRKLGKGFLMHGSLKVNKAMNENETIGAFFRSRQKGSPETFDQVESAFSFWRFDYELE